MTENSHSHDHHISHDDVTQLLGSAFYKETLAFPNLGENELEPTLEATWSQYILAKKKVVAYSAEFGLSLIKKVLPNAKYLVIYEDHSHDAPHGHVEAILDETMHAIELEGDWHDLEWSHEIDELVWDIYNLAKEYFSLVGGKRRLILGR